MENLLFGIGILIGFLVSSFILSLITDTDRPASAGFRKQPGILQGAD